MGKAPKSPRTSHCGSPVLSRPPGKNNDDDDDVKIYDLSPAAGYIPTKLDYSHKHWLNQFISEFGTKLAKRGSRKDNATIWTQNFVLQQFIPHFFGELALTEGDKDWVRDSLGDKIYNFFANHQKRRTQAKAPKAIVKTKRFAQDAYRKAHPEDHDTPVDALVAEESPDLVSARLSVGQMCHFSSLVFKNLPADQQEHWRQVAREELAADQATATLTDPLARERYITGLLKTLQVLVTEAGQKANVRLAIQVLAEQGEGRFKLSSLVSSNLPNFAKSDAIAVVLNALKEEVESSVGGEVEGAIPSPDLLIDFANGGQPLLPDIAGMNLPQLRRLVWAYIKAMYAKPGGVGKVPWEEIGCSLNEWINPNCLPPSFEWIDPGSMPMAQVLLLCDWFIRHQSGELGSETAFQFLKSYAGPKPINASASQETGRELVHCKGQDVYFLRFDNFITKCHAVGGIEAMGYSKSAIAYTRFRHTGKVHADTISITAPTAPPAEWFDLLFGAEVPRSVLFGAEKETILLLATMLPPEHRERVENIVRLINEHQFHLPASNESGLWATPTQPPKIIPSTPSRVPPNPFFVPIWADCYYKTPSSIEETIFYIECWLEAILKSGVLFHEPSGSLVGGDTGVVWVIRVLLKVFFNFVGVKFNIPYPCSIPADCDISRLPLGEWPRLLNQLDAWTQRLRDSIAILQRTSEACSLGLPSANGDDPPSHEPIAYDTVEVSSPAKRPRPSKRKLKQKFNGLEGSESEASFESESSSSEEEEMDFEMVDKGKGRDSDMEENDEEEENGDEDEHEDWEHSNLADSFDLLGNDSPGERSSAHPTPTPSNALFSSAQELTEAQPNFNLQSDSKKPAPRLVPWTRRANAFGTFIQLETYRRKDPKNGKMALEMLDNAERAWATAAGELRMLCGLYNKPLDVDPDELTAASNTVAPVLAEYLLRRRVAWARAESLAHSLFEIAARILKAFRDAIPLHAHLNQTIDLLGIRDQAQNNCRNQIDTLKTRIERSQQSMLEARWTYLELQGFESVATSHLNKLRGDWLSATLPADLTGLHRLALSQLEWAKAFLKAKTAHVEKRKSLWTTVLPLSTFPLRHLTSGMQFAFGNPTSNEEPAGLQDALARAVEELAGPPPSAQLMLNQGSAALTKLPDIVQDVTMTDAPLSVPATQQNPTLERFDDIDRDTTQEPCPPSTDTTLPIVPPSSAEPTLSIVAPAKPASCEVSPAAPVAPAAPAIVTVSPAPSPATGTAPPDLPIPPALPAPTAPIAPTAPPAPPTPPALRAPPALPILPVLPIAVPGDDTEPRQTRVRTRTLHAAEAAKEAATAKEAAAAKKAAAKEAAAAKKAAAVKEAAATKKAAAPATGNHGQRKSRRR